ncbi:MAG: type I methionyl aminopeptidase [Candidatus Saccharimonadales bacterium]
MFTRIKKPQEIEAMRESGQMLASVLKKVEQTVQPGMSGKEIAAMAAQELKALGGKAAFLGYHGYPDVICISVNDEIVHGIPNANPFAEGDILSFDFGVVYKGMITDSAFSMCLGEPSTEQKRLLSATERSLYAGINQLKDGVRIGDIANAIQRVLDQEKLGIIRELVGHGVGHQLHEDPNIPNYGTAGTGPILKAGMTIAIEPMASLSGYHVRIDDDGWTVRTSDGSLSAHFEHTILVTQDGYEILTAW